MKTFTPGQKPEVFITENDTINMRLSGPDELLVTMHQDTAADIIDDNFLEYIPVNSTGFICILGMGLGYGPLAVVRNRPQARHIAIFELDPTIFQATLHYTDLADLLSDPRLLLSITESPEVSQVLATGIPALMLESIHTLRHLPSFIINKKYELVEKQLFNFVNGLNVEGNTNLRYGEKFISNRLGNIKTIHHAYLLEGLQNKLQNIPAFLVAGGPSLDDNIQHLKKAQGKGVIIAVDSVLPTLLENDITPDFVTAIDPQDLVFEKFAPVARQQEAKEISLICMPWVTNKIPQLFPAQKTFWAFAANPMESWLNTLVGGTLLTGGAASVAHLNMQAAVLMGCSPIVFVGQDLAFSKKKDHATGTILTHKDNMEQLLNNSPDLIWAKDTNGKEIATSRSFFFMKKQFEKMIRSSPGTYINASTGGLDIEGTEVLSLPATIQKHCQESRDITNLIHGQANETCQPDSKRVLEEFNQLLQRITELKEIINSTSKATLIALHDIQKLSNKRGKIKSINDLPKKLHGKILAIDNSHNKLDKNGIWHIFHEATLATKRDTDRIRQEIKTLENKPAKYLQWLAKSLRLLEEISTERLRILNFAKEHIGTATDFINHEQELIQNQAKESQLKLARLYYQEKQLVLLEDILAGIEASDEEIAEINFYQGIIAAHKTDYEGAESHFKQARQQNPDFSTKIQSLQEDLAEEYRLYGQNTIIDTNAKRTMLLKGLRLCPHYKPLEEDIRTQTEDILKNLHLHQQSVEGITSYDLDTIQRWQQDLADNNLLSQLLRPEQLVAFYKLFASAQLKDNDILGAIKSYSVILSRTPDDPEIHIQVTDILFKIGEYNQGIQHLTRAIEIDKSYAVHWESLGDNLLKTDQIKEAIYAYEQCFLTLPDNLNALKKMGDCYIKDGQPEAAKEVFSALKTKIMTISHNTTPRA